MKNSLQQLTPHAFAKLYKNNIKHMQGKENTALLILNRVCRTIKAKLSIRLKKSFCTFIRQHWFTKISFIMMHQKMTVRQINNNQ